MKASYFLGGLEYCGIISVMVSIEETKAELETLRERATALRRRF